MIPRHTKEYVYEKLSKINLNVVLIGTYKNSTTTEKWQCMDCFGIFSTSFGNLVSKSKKCPYCSGHRRYLTNVIIDKSLEHRNIKRLDDYKENAEKISFMCLICNYTWKTKITEVLNNHRRSTGCPACSGNLPISNAIIDERLKDRPTIRVSDYSGKCGDNMSWSCKICQNVWEASAENVVNREKTRQTDCPKCFKFTSKKENLVYKLLEDILKIKPEKQHKIKQTIYDSSGETIRKNIQVDFFVEIDNKQIIIEANGPHHYVPVKYWNWTEEEATVRLKTQQTRDEWLKSYCGKNDIYLIEINYMKMDKEAEICQFLKEELGKFILLP